MQSAVKEQKRRRRRRDEDDDDTRLHEEPPTLLMKTETRACRAMSLFTRIRQASQQSRQALQACELSCARQQDVVQGSGPGPSIALLPWRRAKENVTDTISLLTGDLHHDEDERRIHLTPASFFSSPDGHPLLLRGLFSLSVAHTLFRSQ